MMLNYQMNLPSQNWQPQITPVTPDFGVRWGEKPNLNRTLPEFRFDYDAILWIQGKGE